MAKRKAERSKKAKGTIEHKGRQCTRTLAELSAALGIPQAQLTLLQKLPDCPGRGASHLYDIEHWQKFSDATTDQLAALMEADETEVGGDRLNAGKPMDQKKYWEVRKLKANAGMAELSEAKQRGDLVDFEEAVELMSGLIKACFRSLEQVPRAMSPELIGTSLPEFTKRIGKVHRDAIDVIFKGLETKKKTVWRKLFARLCDQFPRTPLGYGASAG